MPNIEYSFGTGEGAPNVHHSEANVDVDGDGKADAVALDFDGDGRVDDVMWDSDGDGVADTALLDENDDGVAEDAYHDPTGLGTWNAHGQGGGAAQSTPEPQPSPGPGPGPGPNDAPEPNDDPSPTGTDNGYEPYGTDDEDGGGTEGTGLPGDLPDTDNHNSGPDLPEHESDSGSDYEPREEEGDTTELFDNVEDAPDVDRESISDWYDDMIN